MIYHYDERTGCPVAKLFYDKGFDNIYLVSGGVEEFAAQYPEFCEGEKIPMMEPRQKK